MKSLNTNKQMIPKMSLLDFFTLNSEETNNNNKKKTQRMQGSLQDT